jgi:G-patch domain
MGRVDDALDTDGLQQASLDAAIPATNRGFQMMQRMGWTQGKGLGAGEDGVHSPSFSL